MKIAYSGRLASPITGAQPVMRQDGAHRLVQLPPDGHLMRREIQERNEVHTPPHCAPTSRTSGFSLSRAIQHRRGVARSPSVPPNSIMRY